MKQKKPTAPKAALYETVRHVAAARLTLGLSRAAIDYLRHASECVSGDDLDHGRTPWCYERVDDMANLLGVDPRTVRNIEHRLADLGLIERRAMANGHRWAKRNRTTGDIEWVHGISLQPLVERRDEMAALAMRIADQERAYRATRQKVHNLRARLRDALTLASGLPALAALRDQTWAVHDAIPARLNRQAHDLDHLTRLAAELTLVLDALLTAFAQAEMVRPDAVSDAVDKASVDVKISDAAEILTLHKYYTTPESLYSCNLAEPPNGGTSSSYKDRAHARSCLENKCAGGEGAHKPRNPVPEEIVLTPDGLLALAPDRWREAIDGIERPDWNVIGYVAAARRAELGVSDHAWQAGIEGMGERRAAICLAVLDANRSHPTKPVRSVGGAFVAMTRRAASGELHLAPSLRWIAARQAGADPSVREAADG